MNYLNRVWIAASVAVVQSHTHTDQGKWKSGLRSLQLNRRRLLSSSGGESAGAWALAGAAGSGLCGLMGSCEDRLRQADESLQRVMYLNCWGQGWRVRPCRLEEAMIPLDIARWSSISAVTRLSRLGSTEFERTSELWGRNWMAHGLFQEFDDVNSLYRRLNMKWVKKALKIFIDFVVKVQLWVFSFLHKLPNLQAWTFFFFLQNWSEDYPKSIAFDLSPN